MQKMIKLTGTEKLLYNATVEFALSIERVSATEANQRAYDKIMASRALRNKVGSFKH